MVGFIRERRVAFGDCDPARIAYTGRLADFALEAIDAFWDDLLDGRGWYHMNLHQGFGMPFVRMEYDFTSPVTCGPPLLCEVAPERIGTTSVTLRVRARQEDRDCFTARFVSVFANIAQRAKIPVPADIRAALQARFPDQAGGA